MLKVLSLAVGVLAGTLIFLGGKWALYVTNTTSPYDDAGIELNRWAPAPMRAWGCGKLQATFPQALPPEGCKAADGGWVRGG